MLSPDRIGNSQQLLTPSEAERAVYIDFEALATAPRVIGLLGVAFSDGGDEVVRQFVVDEILRGAVKSRPTCEGMSLEDAVRVVVEQAAALDGPIVSWSNYDRELIFEHPDVSNGLKEHVKVLHRNSIATATRWLNRFHPDVDLVKPLFGGRNQLKQFLPIVGYAVPGRLAAGNAARWLRHMREQLQKHDGRLRDVSPRAKRHWSMLLDYNRHDCLGLRAVTMRAARENALWRAYERTIYRARADCGDIEIRIGSPNRTFLRRVLEPSGAQTWAFITASNPDSRPLPERENAARHESLRAAVNSLGLTAFEGRGEPADGNWPAERSLLVLGISRGRAISLGRKFGQVCIVFGRRGEKAELVLTKHQRTISD